MADRCFALFAASLLLLAGAAHAQDLISEYFDEGIEWVSDMSYENQLPVPKESEATGTAFYTLIDTTDYLAVNFTVFLANYVVAGVSNDNRTVTFAHIHVGTATVSGPILAVLYSNKLGGPANLPTPVHDDREWFLAQGTITSSDLLLPGWNFESFLEAMDNGTLYTNVHSTKYPNGELRGQIYPAVTDTEAPTVATQSI